MITFYALDNEFAAATGKNVNSGVGGDGTSSFDYPPNSTFGLTITSNEDPDDARLFEVGEVYTVEWGGGPGGGAFLEKATVIRSDDLDTNAGAIVFEGYDEKGDLTQVVWSPNFDLQKWYWDNFENGQSPGFYTYDRSASTHRFVCFAAGTMIDTPRGPRDIATLQPGDRVTTRDHGVQDILAMTDQRAPGIGASAPVQISSGVLGARAPVCLSPNHRVLCTGWQAELWFGVPEVFAPAKALVGLDGVTRVAHPRVRYIHLMLPVHGAVFANGLAAESLLRSDYAKDAQPHLHACSGPDRTAYPSLSAQEATLLAANLATSGITGAQKAA